MASTRSVTSKNSLSHYHELHISNHPSRIGLISAISYSAPNTTITFTETTNVTGESLFSASTPGLYVVVEGVASGDEGKTGDIETFSGDDITVAADLTSILAAGDLLAYVPPMASRVSMSGGHTLGVTMDKDETLALGERALRSNVHTGVNVGGTIPFFVSYDSEAFTRLLLTGTGSYKKSATGTHKFRPPSGNDGTFTDAEDWCAYSKDGNDIVNQVFGGLFTTRLDLNFGQGSSVTGSAQVMGTHVIREVGGSGKAFPMGSGNWNRGAAIERDSGKRHTYTGVVAEIGGTFGDALTTAHQRNVTELNVSTIRNPADNRVLGSQDKAIPVESTAGFMVSGRRLLDDDTIYQDYYGGSGKATPAPQVETRLLIKAVAAQDTTKTISIDAPRGVWRSSTIQRQDGRFEEQFTFQAMQTLAANNADSTAVPLYEYTVVNGVDIDLLAGL